MSGGELMQPPLALVIEFRMPRPKAHYKASGEIKADADEQRSRPHVGKPIVLDFNLV